MTEQATIPEYGASIAIEDSTASFYLRERALDAVQEQVVDDLNAALELLNGRGILVGTDHLAIHDLLAELTAAADLTKVAWEIAWSKTPVEDED